VPDLAVPGQPQGGGPGVPAGAVAPLAPGLRRDRLPRNGQPVSDVPADDGWDRDGDDWDPAGSLTAEEIAALAALDREGDPVHDGDEDPGDAAPVGAAAWLADPWPGLQGDEPYPPPHDGPVEALPGLTPRRLGTGGGSTPEAWRIACRRGRSWPG